MSPDSEPLDRSGDGAPGASVGTGWRRGLGAATTTVLLRHGQTALSVERRFAGRGDIPLTHIGRQQAAAAATRLAERGGIELIVTSPLGRARRTAEAVAERLGVPIAVDNDLVETDFGEWEGMTFGEVSQRWPELMRSWLADPDAAPPGGESFAAVAVRVQAALQRMLAAQRGRTIVVVSHVTPIKTLVCQALLAPSAAMFRMHLDVASFSEVDWFADGPALLRSLNETAHLRSAALLRG